MVAMIVGYAAQLIDVTLSTDTNAYGSADLLADTQAVAGVMRLDGGTAMLESITVLDEDDQGAAFDLYFLQNSTSLGTENSVPNMSDANARANFLAKVAIGTGDYSDLGGFRVATVGNLRRLLKAAPTTKDIYIAAVNGSGTPTFTASGLKLRLGIVQY